MANSRKPRVFFYVQHLLGIGHLRRAAILCREMSQSHFDVTLVMGGRPVAPLDIGEASLVHLPSLHIGDGGFHDLVDHADRPVDEHWKAQRRDQLLQAFENASPDILIIEAFPFGRRQMRFELLPLLAAAKQRRNSPRVVCSVRDILKSGRKPGRAEETAALIAENFDLVLVHGDAGFVELEETFPATASFTDKIRYTGIVAEPILPNRSAPVTESEVLVSAGGGAVGTQLFRMAMKARALSAFHAITWRLLVGPNLDADTFRALNQEAPDGVVIEPYRKDFRELLSTSRVSVSQAGYNTVADILSTSAPAVLVPFDLDGEDEQPRRAGKLAKMGRVVSLTSAEMTIETLAAAVDRAAALPISETQIELDGAAKSARILTEMLGR